MAIEFDLKAYLSGRSPVTAIVGSRVFADRAPQKADSPRIVLKSAPGSRRFYHSLGASGLIEESVVVWCRGNTPEQAKAIYEAVRNEIDGFQGTWNGTDVRSAFLGPSASVSAMPSEGDDVGSPAVGATLEVTYRESIPTLGN